MPIVSKFNMITMFNTLNCARKGLILVLSVRTSTKDIKPGIPIQTVVKIMVSDLVHTSCSSLNLDDTGCLLLCRCTTATGITELK